MVETNCVACEEIKQKDPNLIATGWSDAECNSFKNDTGLTPTDSSNDCEDLELLNDCLIGNLDAEVELKDVCDWRDFMHDMIPNLHTMGNAFRCAICGLWTNVHSLWSAVASYRLRKSGNNIILDAWDGEHGRVSLSDVGKTYEISKSGSTITLTGSDGSTSSVPDSNTTYRISKSGSAITLTGSDGSTSSVSDKDTTYSLSKEGNKIQLTSSAGVIDEVTDSNTKYRLSTKSYTFENVAVVAGDTAVYEFSIDPPDYPDVDTFTSFAVAGWTWEGTFASYLVTRYIQLIGRSSDDPKVKVAIRNIATPAEQGAHDALVTFYPEVLWFGVRND